MSTTFDEMHEEMYTVLDNGSLIITNLTSSDFRMKVGSRLYSFEGVGTVDTWLIDKYKLYYFNKALYLLCNGELRVINVHS